MSIRFQADADLNQIIVLATIRREPAIDFETAVAAAADDLLLIWALTEPAEWTNRICFLPLWRHFPAMESPKTAERKSDLTTGSSLNVDRDKTRFQCRATRRPRQGTCDGKLTVHFFEAGPSKWWQQESSLGRIGVLGRPFFARLEKEGRLCLT